MTTPTIDLVLGPDTPVDTGTTTTLAVDELNLLADTVDDKLAETDELTIRIRDEVAAAAVPFLIVTLGAVLARPGHRAAAQRQPFGYVDVTIYVTPPEAP